MLNCKDAENWPEIDKKNLVSEIKFAVQVNGKTRDILNVKKNLKEEDISKIIIKKSKAYKYLKDKKVIKTIFINDKIINYIISK